jgi:flagellar protein FlaG
LSVCAGNVFDPTYAHAMTAVSFTAPPLSPIQSPLTSATRAAEGVVAMAKGGRQADDAGKSAQQAAQVTAGARATVKALSESDLASQVQDLQVKMDKLNPALAFVLDQTTGRALIQLTDRTTKEIIQQFPTAAALQISKALDRFEKGQLINKTA